MSIDSIIRRRINRRLSGLIGTRKGRCYIIGDGISSRHIDPEHFRDENLILVGASPSIPGLAISGEAIWIFPEPEVLLNTPAARVVGLLFRRSLRPPVPFLSWREFAHFRDAYVAISRLVAHMQVFVHVTNYFSFRSERKCALFRFLPRSDVHGEIRGALDSSLNASVSLALMLGYSDVNLVGFDYLLDPPQSGHWYEDVEAVPSPELFGHYREFLAQFEGKLSITHVLLRGQRSQIRSVVYDEILGVPKSESNVMPPPIKIALKQSGQYRIGG